MTSEQLSTLRVLVRHVTQPSKSPNPRAEDIASLVLFLREHGDTIMRELEGLAAAREFLGAKP